MAGLTTIRVSAFHEVCGFCPRLWLGGEEELFALDLAANGWWMCWAEDVVIHHAPSRFRDARRPPARHSQHTLDTVATPPGPQCAAAHMDDPSLRAEGPATVLAVLEALRATPWVLRERRVVPSRVEPYDFLRSPNGLQQPAATSADVS
jgi:hypothetical protein